ncbi:response regulator transcription factor [Actinomadura gamaensis]|uniref:DNA-binding response regulator n=1 Tax=Actinomadura gamaensis TaxID=1763541 RepID=A0ABV9U3U0_9ACTN
MNTVRVLLADDQRLFREAVRSLLRLQPGIEVVAEAATGRQALDQISAHDPDLAVLDIEMPDGDGLHTARTLQEHGARCKVLIVTTFGRAGYLQRAIDSGVVGFILKDASADALAHAIRRCAEGHKIIDPGLAAAARRTGPSPLTPREREVLRATAGGATVPEIAALLHLSQGTVRNKISSAIAKLSARNRTDALRIATRNGWL